MKTMKIVGLVAVLSVVASGICVAEEYPYVGEVTGQDVYVRCEPNTASYAVTKISAPSRVTVEKKVAADWLAIKPVSGCYGVVSKNYIQLDPEGKYGMITGDNVRLRAAGQLRRTNFYGILCKLDKDEKVRIVGYAEDEDGAWYIVKPTDKALFYISAQYVKRTDETSAEEMPEKPVEDTILPEDKKVTVAVEEAVTEIPQPDKKTEEVIVGKTEVVESKEGTAVIEEKAVAEIPVPAAPAPVAAPVVAKSADKPKIRTESEILSQIRALEKEIVNEGQKPANQRDMNGLLAKAQALDVPAGSRFKPIYDSLVEYLKDEIELTAEAARTDALVKKALAGTTEPVAAAEAAPAKSARGYDFQGRLEISKLWKFGGDNDRHYILRDPDTQDFIGYVSPASTSVDLDGHVGQIVAVAGDMDYSRTTGGKVLRVTHLDVIDEGDYQAMPNYAEKTEPAKAPAEPTEPVFEQPEPATPEVANVPEEPSMPSVDKSAESEETPKVPVMPIPEAETAAGKSSGEPKMLVPDITKPKIEDIDIAKNTVKTPNDMPPVELAEETYKPADDAMAPKKPIIMDVPKVVQEDKVVKLESAPKPDMDKPIVDIPEIIPPEPVEDAIAKKAAPKKPEVKMPDITPPAEPEAPKVVAVEEPKTPELKTEKVSIPDVPAPKEPIAVAEPPVEEPKMEKPDIEVPKITPPVEEETEVVILEPEKPSITEPELPEYDEGPAVEMKSLDLPDMDKMGTAKTEPTKPEFESLAPPTAPKEEPEAEIAAKPMVEPDIKPHRPTERKASRPVLPAVDIPGYDKPVRAKTTVVEGEYELEWD